MRILLLSVNSYKIYYDQLVVPFGLAGLGSYVQADGHTIHGIEMNSPPERGPDRYLKLDRELLGAIEDFRPDLVAMTTYASNIHNVLFWAFVIKDALPNVTIAVGGNHASYIGREIIETCPAVDVVIRFEGEIPFKALCDTLAAGSRRFDGVPNAVFRSNGQIAETPLVPLVPDLNALPPLRRDFFGDVHCGDHTHADVISARGCPYHCTFCNCNHYWKKKYRTISAQRVGDELRQLKAANPRLRTVRFRDEAISISRKHCRELCDCLIEANLGLEFHAHSRLDGLDDEIAARLAAAGFRQLYVGLESGSQAVLERLQKGIRFENAHRITESLRRHGIAVRFSLMLRTPGETLEEAAQTIEVPNTLDLDFDEFYFGQGIQVYPGTTDCERFLQKFPGYRWLETRDLGEGYRQVRDPFGHATAVHYDGAEYDPACLNAEISRRLAGRLARHGEHDYRAFLETRGVVDRICKRHGSVEAARRRAQALIDKLDGRGEPWGIIGDGYYYRQLLAPAVEAGCFAGYAGRAETCEISPGRPVRLDPRLRRTRTLVFALSVGRVRCAEIAHELWAAGQYGGTVILLHNWLSNADDRIETAELNPTDRVPASRPV